MKHIAFGLVMGFFATVAAVDNAFAVIVFDVVESDGNVEVTMSGSMDLAATQGFNGTSGGAGDLGYYRASAGTIATGPVSGLVDSYEVDFTNPPGWAPFGTGEFGRWDETSGSPVSLTTNPYLSVPGGYFSGDSLSGTATKFGATFASLGFTPGSYVTSLTNGNNIDTVTVNIGVVPEPTSFLLLTIGLCGAVAFRRKLEKR